MPAHHRFENVACDFGFEGVIIEFSRPFLASHRFFEFVVLAFYLPFVIHFALQKFDFSERNLVIERVCAI